ncbi:MFS transporter [Kribbella catacumbae]|uniref:MFS transporter n=1 Tax=Kribbella catacumbae TaxID=460086 RepID=UPI00035CC7E8|nr:MFS transporter [Kribbella catacumbae]
MKARPVWAVTVEGFTTRLGFGMVTFALPLYALQLGMSLVEIGLLIGAKAFIEPAVKPLMGAAVDRWGARRGYLTAVTIRLAASILLLGASTPALLYGVRLIQGAASAARDPASMNVVAASTTRRLGTTFSLTIGAKDLGNVAAGATGGAVLAVTGGNFTVLWTIVAVLAVLPVVVVWLWVPADSPVSSTAAQPVHETVEAEPPQPPARGVLRDRRLRLLCVLGLLTGMTAHMTHGMFQVLAAEVAGLSVAQIGLIYSFSFVVLLVVGPLAGWSADRFGTDALAGARGVANAVSSLTYLVFPSFGGILGGRIVDDAGKAAFRPTWGTMLAQAARRSGPRRGRVVATLDTALSFGEALGPLLAALLWDLWGLATFLLVRAALGIATELLVTRRLRSQKRGRRRTARIATPVLAIAATAGLAVAILLWAKSSPPDLGDPLILPPPNSPLTVNIEVTPPQK